jgi:hypothetical protein
MSVHIRDGFRRYVAWITPYSRYLFTKDLGTVDTPLVLISSFQHSYVRNLRQSLHRDVVFMPWRQPGLFAPRVALHRVGIFHLHFINELGLDLEGTEEFIGRLRSAGTAIVWTGHDLISHDKDYARFQPIFSLWAEAADGVIHHSRAGENTVIVHPYRREHADQHLRGRRAEIEASLGMAPASIRVGLIGMPRVERRVVDFLIGVARSTNREIQVVCWSLRHTETAPLDERIAVAECWRYVDDDVISRRLAICDLIAIPVAPDGEMLTTGLVSDALGMGLGMLISSWDFLDEVAGEAGILCGDTADEIAESLNRLVIDDVVKAKQASMTIREGRHWDQARIPLLEFYRIVLANGRGGVGSVV